MEKSSISVDIDNERWNWISFKATVQGRVQVSIPFYEDAKFFILEARLYSIILLKSPKSNVCIDVNCNNPIISSGTLAKQYDAWLYSSIDAWRKLPYFISSLIERDVTSARMSFSPEEQEQPNAALTLAHIAGKLSYFDFEIWLLARSAQKEPNPLILRSLAKAFFQAAKYSRARDCLRKLVELGVDISEFQAMREMSAELDARDRIQEMVSDRSWSTSQSTAHSSLSVAYVAHKTLSRCEGGYAMRTHGLAKAISQLDDVSIAVFERPRAAVVDDNDAPAIADCRTIDGISYFYNHEISRDGRLFRYLLQSSDYLVQQFERSRPTIVHAASNFWTALPAAIAANRLGLPFIYEVRSFWEQTRLSRDPTYWRSGRYRREKHFENIVYSLSDRLITLNYMMKQHIVRRGVEPSKIAIVPNGVDPGRFDHRAELHPLPDDFLDLSGFKLGYIGSFREYEGLDIAVKAIAYLVQSNHDVSGYFAGADLGKIDDHSTVEGMLSQLISDMDLQNRIKIVGRVHRDSVPQLYRQFDACVYSRHADPVCQVVPPLKPLEAMASGTSVIVADVAAMSDLARMGRTAYVVDSGSVDSLSQAIQRIIAHPEEARRKARDAKAFVRTERSWEGAAYTLREIYQNCLS